MSADLIKSLLERRAEHKSALDTLLAGPTTEKRDLNSDEETRFADHETKIKEIDVRVTELDEQLTRDAAAAKVAERYIPKGGAQVLSEPKTYDRGNGNSYFMDLARAQVRNDVGAQARLQRHAAELAVDLPDRARRRQALAEQELRSIDGLAPRQRESVFEQRVNPNRTDGQGGYFVPPVWLIDQYIDLPRFGRETANLCNGLTLPPGTDSINLPKVSTGTTAAVQTADGGAVSSTDLTDTFVNAPVRTIAGQQDVALQLLDQSPISFDEVIYQDLIADLNMKLDVQVINGSGASGQAQGILGTSGINAITYTDASPTLPAMYVPIAKAASQVFKNRKLPATGGVMIPSLWYWATSQLDTTNRPLITPMTVAYNPAAMQNGLGAEGPLGMLSLGLPVFGDGNVPSNLGGGTNETRLIVARWNDLYLWEGSLQTRVLTEVLSGTLQVRFQVYKYFAFMANRRPEAISVISGTGTIPAAGF